MGLIRRFVSLCDSLIKGGVKRKIQRLYGRA